MFYGDVDFVCPSAMNNIIEGFISKNNNKAGAVSSFVNKEKNNF